MCLHIKRSVQVLLNASQSPVEPHPVSLGFLPLHHTFVCTPFTHECGAEFLNWLNRASATAF
jgi:hypothetical protein